MFHKLQKTIKREVGRIMVFPSTIQKNFKMNIALIISDRKSTSMKDTKIYLKNRAFLPFWR